MTVYGRNSGGLGVVVLLVWLTEGVALSRE